MPAACNATRRTTSTWPDASVRRARGSRGRRAAAAAPAATTAGRSPRPSSAACANCVRSARAGAGRSRALLAYRPVELLQVPARALERKPEPVAFAVFSGACCECGCGPELERQQELDPERKPDLDLDLEPARR